MSSVLIPDIAFAVNKLYRYIDVRHREAGKGVLKYLESTQNFKIIYLKKKDLFVKGFCDSDYAN